MRCIDKHLRRRWGFFKEQLLFFSVGLFLPIWLLLLIFLFWFFFGYFFSQSWMRWGSRKVDLYYNLKKMRCRQGISILHIGWLLFITLRKPTWNSRRQTTNVLLPYPYDSMNIGHFFPPALTFFHRVCSVSSSHDFSDLLLLPHSLSYDAYPLLFDKATTTEWKAQNNTSRLIIFLVFQGDLWIQPKTRLSLIFYRVHEKDADVWTMMKTRHHFECFLPGYEFFCLLNYCEWKVALVSLAIDEKK